MTEDLEKHLSDKECCANVVLLISPYEDLPIHTTKNKAAEVNQVVLQNRHVASHAPVVLVVQKKPLALLVELKKHAVRIRPVVKKALVKQKVAVSNVHVIASQAVQKEALHVSKVQKDITHGIFQTTPT